MAEDLDTIDLDTSKIKNWRSIVTLIVFVVTNITVLFPFHIPVYVPRILVDTILNSLVALRIIPPRHSYSHHGSNKTEDEPGKDHPKKAEIFVRMEFPMNFITAPLIADLFLLAILAIGRKEVHDGTVGADHIDPIDIMVFFISLAYIAISIDASGLIRFLAFKVLQKGGKVGHRLFFYLYAFFFGIGSFIGNDPIILSGTAFLAYMTRVSSNIIHPRAWIYTQFAVANIASAILVSSNPTNLVLAGAFNIKFIVYTANMIVPVVVTAIVLFPFLLYIIFADPALIPLSIDMHELSEEEKAKKPVNPNIPNARGNAEEEENRLANDEQGKLLSLEEIMNPFLDKGGAAFGAIIMSATLVTIIALNAASQSTGEHPVFYVTLPAAVVMFCWDLGFGWYHRHETREIARRGREDIERARAERERAMRQEEDVQRGALDTQEPNIASTYEPTYPDLTQTHSPDAHVQSLGGDSNNPSKSPGQSADDDIEILEDGLPIKPPCLSRRPPRDTGILVSENGERKLSGEIGEKNGYKLERGISRGMPVRRDREGTTVVSLLADAYRWSQETFPTVTAVLSHLPFALVPFAFSMFVLVQALVTKGWVPVFAYGWDHWVEKTGTVGSIGGMGFLSVILCNFAGTNIGTTILLSRVIQAWQQIHFDNGIPISDRTFWATVYGMALGVNYGAFSTAFSASLAGMLWRDILGRKHIHVRGLDFARVNLPIIAISMTVGCAVLIGEVYIMRNESPYSL